MRLPAASAPWAWGAPPLWEARRPCVELAKPMRSLRWLRSRVGHGPLEVLVPHYLFG